MARYHLITAGTKKVLLGEASTRVVRSLVDAGKDGMTYSDLVRRTKSPAASLYVLGQRLRDAGIVKSKTNGDGERVLTLLSPKKTNIEAVKTLG